MPVYVHILPGKARTEAFPGCCFADHPKYLQTVFRSYLSLWSQSLLLTRFVKFMKTFIKPFVKPFCKLTLHKVDGLAGKWYSITYCKVQPEIIRVFT